ncbi:topoisomerase DNA-binding C4 zinc finger domain-containing protein [Candidatus Mycoplasma pogonae]
MEANQLTFITTDDPEEMDLSCIQNIEEDMKVSCISCLKGKLKIKEGKYGKFFGCSNYPACKYTKKMTNK